MRFLKNSRWTKSLLVGMLCSLSASVYGVDNFLSIQEVKPGMEGVAKTVFQGDTIDTFPVKILGVLKDKGPSGDLILADFSSPLIEKTGGIAHGMSGSPVYIDGKLVGAVAYGWGFSKSHVGMITPIEQMLVLLKEPYEDQKQNPWESEGQLLPLGTPLMALGFEPDALAYMQDKLKNYHIHAYDTASGANDEIAKPLEPGSSVAASLVNGDLKLGAIGTVTYVDDDKMVAFGHPFLRQGRTQYFMHNAHIFTIINSVESSFKLGSVGAAIGVITEDRGAGIAGSIGQYPAYTPIYIDILDQDRNIAKKANVEVVDERELAPSLIATSVYSFLTKTMDRRGGGTVKIQYTITPNDDALPAYTRTDMFTSRSGIAMKSMDDFYNILDKLVNNSYKAYNLSSVAVNIDVTKEYKEAKIINASATPAIVSPGDDIMVKVKLHTYRGNDEEKTIIYSVPKDIPLGDVLLEVRGGGETPLPYLIEQQKLNLTDEVISRIHMYQNFEELFKKLQEVDANHQIVVEILENDVSVIAHDKEDKKGAKLFLEKDIDSADTALFNAKSVASDEVSHYAERIDTEYVIKGDGQLNITIVSKEKQEAALKAYAKKQEKSQAKL